MARPTVSEQVVEDYLLATLIGSLSNRHSPFMAGASQDRDRYFEMLYNKPDLMEAVHCLPGSSVASIFSYEEHAPPFLARVNCNLRGSECISNGSPSRNRRN